VHATLVPMQRENTLFAKLGSLNSMLNTERLGLTEFSSCLRIPFGVCNRTLGAMLISVDFCFCQTDWLQSNLSDAVAASRSCADMFDGNGGSLFNLRCIRCHLKQSDCKTFGFSIGNSTLFGFGFLS
jgi:hypothetical protein